MIDMRQKKTGSVLHHDGASWVKVRTLRDAEFRRAMLDADFDRRIGTVTPATFRALGWRLRGKTRLIVEVAP